MIMANPVYVTCSHGGRSRKDRTVSKDWKNVRCWETSFGSNAMVFGVHMYQAWTLPIHQTTHFKPVYTYIVFIYLMKKKRWKMTNKLLTSYIVFARLPAQEDNPLIFLAPLAAWAIISSVLWLFHQWDGISMGSPWWKGAVKEAVGVSRI